MTSMKAVGAFLFACAIALPAMANREFAAPSVAMSLPAAAGEAVAASGGKTFVANAAANRVSVVDEAGHVTYVAVGPQPRYIVALGFGFMTSNAGDGSVSLSRDLATASSMSVGGSGPMLVDPRGRVYLLRPDGFVVIIDPASFTARTFDTGLRSPVAHAVRDGALAVADASGEVRVFNSAIGNGPTLDYTIHVPGRPFALLSFDNYGLYVAAEGAAAATITRVDFSAIPIAVQTSTLPAIGHGARAAKIVSGWLVAGFSDGLLLYNLSTRYTEFFPGEVLSIDVDPSGAVQGWSGRAFVLDANRNLRVIEPLTLHDDVLALQGSPTEVRYNPGTCNAYVAGSTLAVVRAPCSSGVAPKINAQALWWIWSGTESGWGLNVAQQGSKLFATWFTYDADGQPTWLVVSDASSVGLNQYSGEMYRTTGPAFSAPSFDPSRVTRTRAGTASFFVSSADYMTFWPKTDAWNAQLPLGRQLFSTPQPQCDSDVTPGPLPIYQDLWWNPSESGWGLNIAHQGNILFITWFTYDTDGKATWFVGSDIEKTGNATYSGTLYKTFGPPMTASPWDPSKVTRLPVGSATLTFRDDDNGTFAYTVSGVSGSKAITRQVFATPTTHCR
jgi:DNA-binding beta-propeller fold protein YncE